MGAAPRRASGQPGKRRWNQPRACSHGHRLPNLRREGRLDIGWKAQSSGKKRLLCPSTWDGCGSTPAKQEKVQAGRFRGACSSPLLTVRLEWFIPTVWGYVVSYLQTRIRKQIRLPWVINEIIIISKSPPLGSLVVQLVKNLPAMQETQVWSPGEGNGNPLQYSCLEIPMDREAWWATVHGVTKSQTRLSDEHFHFPNPKGYMNA